MKWLELPKKEPEFGIDYALASNGDWHKGKLKSVGFDIKIGNKLFSFEDGNGDPIHDVTHFVKLDLPVKTK